MYRKIIIPLFENDVAPRFDLATEVVIVRFDSKDSPGEEKMIVMPQASAEQLCHLVLTERIDTVICGGIEEEYYQYLTWKQVEVIDSVIGPWVAALKKFRTGGLKSCDILSKRVVEGKNVSE